MADAKAKTKTAAAQALMQDPHQVSEPREKNLEVAIGRAVRNFRRQKAMTVADLSKQTGLSIGMLSKIENGITSPSLSTLQSVPESMLGAMFSGRFELARQPDGSIFIDRDGRLFGHVLNWLRDRQVAPLAGADRAQLRAEASFYQLHALLAVLDEEDSAIAVNEALCELFVAVLSNSMCVWRLETDR